ncbi:MAG: galactose-1-phosphate uridylyltransferase [Verrucomicrobiota bacterium]
MNQTEMRQDPLRKSWTLFSDARTVKPPLLSRKKGPASATGQPGISPFTAGNESFTPPALHEVKSGDQWQVRVIPNRAPALQIEGQPGISADGFYDRMDSIGAHELIVEAPGSETFESLPLPAIGEVINAWKLRMLDLARDHRMRSFFIVKNSGETAGAGVPHAISQLFAMAVVPPVLRQKLEVARDFFERKKRSIFEDILRDEVRVATRLVYENNGFAVFCPYASRSPFELAIYPKRQCPDFHGISDQEQAQLADALKTALLKLNRALDMPQYNLVLFTAPARTARRDQWNTIEHDFRWHIEIVPRLFYTDGFELATGCQMNPVWPETAAEFLRKIEL